MDPQGHKQLYMGSYKCVWEVVFSHPSVTTGGVCDHQGVTKNQYCMCVYVCICVFMCMKHVSHSNTVTLIKPFHLLVPIYTTLISPEDQPSEEVASV